MTSTPESRTPEVALVTGGGGGVGSAVVAALAGRGMRVGVAGRDLARAESVAATHPGCVGVELDVTSPESWAQARQTLEASLGAPDVFVAAAGTIVREPFLESAPESWEAMFATNVIGVLAGASELVPGMVGRGYGRVIGISSVTARIGAPNRAVYGATKGALEAFCRGLGVELAGTGVTANCVAAGAVRTPFNSEFLRPGTATGDATLRAIPEGRYGTPEEVATAVLYLVDAGYSQGAVVQLDGGWGIS